MKKFLAASLAVLMCLSFAACGDSEVAVKPDSVSETEVLIASIGEVTIENANAVLDAEAAYLALSEDMQAQVSNRVLLSDARVELNRLYVSDATAKINNIGLVKASSAGDIIAARIAYDAVPDSAKSEVSNYSKLTSAENSFRGLYIEPVERSINKIGTVTLESKEKIDSARSAYDSLSADAKAMVSNYALLTLAEDNYLKCKAQSVIALIDAVGNVNYGSKNAIETARAAYDELTEDEKKFVSNSDALTSAESEYEALESEINAAEILSRLRIEYDGSFTWYESTVQPEFLDSKSFVLPYIGTNQTVWLRLVFDYVGDYSVNFNRITVIADDNVYAKSFSASDITRNQANGRVWEYIDVAPTDADIEMLWAIANSENAYVRFEGSSVNRKLEFTDADKAAITDILLYYQILSENQ